MKSLQDLCRDRRDCLRMTAQAISDESGVPLSTVNNFFSSASKKPNLETAGPICRVLGISLDSYFGIEAPERELAGNEQTLLEKDLAHEREKTALLETIIRQKNRVVYLMFGMCGVLSLLLILYLVIDSRITNAGLIKFGRPSAAACVVIVIVVAALGLLSWAIAYIQRHRGAA